MFFFLISSWSTEINNKKKKKTIDTRPTRNRQQRYNITAVVEAINRRDKPRQVEARLDKTKNKTKSRDPLARETSMLIIVSSRPENGFGDDGVGWCGVAFFEVGYPRNAAAVVAGPTPKQPETSFLAFPQ